MIEEDVWPAYGGEKDPGNPGETQRTLEAYAYDIYGQRIGVQFCTHNHFNNGGPIPDDYPNAASSCKDQVYAYDYVDGQLLVEANSPNMPEGPRLISIYTWGVTGVVARRGLSIRDGEWNSKKDHFEPSKSANPMCDYTYVKDHAGNVVGLFACDSGQGKRQVFDAFGNNIGGYITFQCSSDHTYHDLCEDYWTGPTTCPSPPEEPEPIEWMQAGDFQWRGGEGSITDRVQEDQRNRYQMDNLRYSAYTKLSTGLVYMQARYYEPETGRFTQFDSRPYQFSDLKTGQNNRWTYCGSDPVNMSDPSGNFIEVFLVAALIVGLIGLGLILMRDAVKDPGARALYGTSLALGMVSFGLFSVALGVAAFLFFTGLLVPSVTWLAKFLVENAVQTIATSVLVALLYLFGNWWFSDASYNSQNSLKDKIKRRRLRFQRNLAMRWRYAPFVV